MKIGLYIKEELQDSDIATKIISKISEYGLDFDQEYPDIVIFVGGDGTFLRAVHEYINQLGYIKFIGINEGSLGFYPDYVMNELNEMLQDILNEDYHTYSFPLIKAVLGEDTIYAVNEIRIENPFHTLISEVYIDDDYLETYRGNGLSIASSFGSTAYNKSLGGAVVIPDLATLQLSEIAPINNKVYNSLNSSLVCSYEHVLKLKGNFGGGVIGYDHLTIKRNIEEISVELSDKIVHLIMKDTHSYIDKLRDSFLK